MTTIHYVRPTMNGYQEFGTVDAPGLAGEDDEEVPVDDIIAVHTGDDRIVSPIPEVIVFPDDDLGSVPAAEMWVLQDEITRLFPSPEGITPV
jgi:hypothetical protein